MLYYNKQLDGWHIAVWHVTETIDELLSLLPDDEAVRSEADTRFSAPSRRMEWVAVRVLLFSMLGRQVPISYDDDGAPLLPDYEDLDISISHTRGYVAVALAESGRVGIDVEQVSDRVERVRSRFVRPDEQADSLPALLLHWSAKETAFKLLHHNKVDLQRHLRVEPFVINDEQEGLFLLHETRTDDERTIALHYKLFPDFVLTYARVSA